MCREGSGRPQAQCGIHSWAQEVVDLVGDLTIVDDDVVGTVVQQGLRAILPASRGKDSRHPTPSRRSTRPGRPRRCRTDKERLSAGQVEAGGEGAIRGLKGFRHRTDDLPGEVRGERDDLVAGDDGVLGVPAVEGPPHSAHQGGDLLAWFQIAAGSGIHDGDGLDAENPGEGDALGETEPGVQLEAVQAERLHVCSCLAERLRSTRDVPSTG